MKVTKLIDYTPALISEFADCLQRNWVVDHNKANPGQSKWFDIKESDHSWLETNRQLEDFGILRLQEDSGIYQVDISHINSNYLLPESLAKDNYDQALEAIELVLKAVKKNKKLDSPEVVEDISAAIHHGYCVRRGKPISSYSDLSEEYKEMNRNISRAAIKLVSDFIQSGLIEEFDKKFNITYVKKPLDVELHVLAHRIENWSKLPQRIATAGYSNPPEGYSETTTQLVSSVVDHIGQDKVGIATSPTIYPNTIDEISTKIAQAKNLGILYLTAKDYKKYITDPISPDVRQTQFRTDEKFVFESSDEYSEATSRVSNALMITGGRDVAVMDFANAVREGNRVVIVDNEKIDRPAWNSQGKNNRLVDNASKYLAEQLAAYLAGSQLPHPTIPALEKVLPLKDRLAQLVTVLRMRGPEDIPQVAKQGADFILAA